MFWNAPTFHLKLTGPAGILKDRYASWNRFWLPSGVQSEPTVGFQVLIFTCEVTRLLPYSNVRSTQLPCGTLVPLNMPYASTMRGYVCSVVSYWSGPATGRSPRPTRSAALM